MKSNSNKLFKLYTYFFSEALGDSEKHDIMRTKRMYILFQNKLCVSHTRILYTSSQGL